MTLLVNGAELAADRSGALWWPERRLLAVADLHLEKGSAYAARGQFLPPYDTSATLARLEDVVERLRPAHVVAMGDTFHDEGAASRMGAAARARLAALVARVGTWTWIAGNHDPAPPGDLGGEIAETAAVGPLLFRHEPQARPVPGEIAGHLHPAATVVVRGRGLRRRCFAADGTRLVMPAFGAYAGGLDVRDPAIAGLFAGRFHAWMLGEGTAHPVSSVRLGIMPPRPSAA